MIDIDEWLEFLDEEDNTEIKDNEKYKHELFLEYVLRKNDKFKRKRRELYEQYQKDPSKLFGEKGLRKQLAAFDLSYFGRAYLAHFFKRVSPAFHEELDDTWVHGVMKDKNP